MLKVLSTTAEMQLETERVNSAEYCYERRTLAAVIEEKENEKNEEDEFEFEHWPFCPLWTFSLQLQMQVLSSIYRRPQILSMLKSCWQKLETAWRLFKTTPLSLMEILAVGHKERSTRPPGWKQAKRGLLPLFWRCIWSPLAAFGKSSPRSLSLRKAKLFYVIRTFSPQSMFTF